MCSQFDFDVLKYLSGLDCSILDLCRICLCSKSETWVHLLSKHEFQNVAETFTYVSSISVSPDDKLPLQLCEACNQKIIVFSEFKHQCERSDTALRYFLKDDSNFPNGKKNKASKKESDGSFHFKKEEILQDDENCKVQEMEFLEDIESGNEFEYVKAQKDHDEARTDEKHSRKSKKTKSKQVFKCKHCSQEFRKPNTLRNHLKVKHVSTQVSSELPYACKHCMESFSSEHDLKLHSALHAITISASNCEIWKCIQCNKEFSARAMLRRHIQRHMMTKRHTCDTCGKMFTELYALRRHLRVHTGELAEKRYICSICEKRFIDKKQLATHLSRHTGDRPFVCSTCGKTFPSNRLLTSHQLVHSDDKPYSCQYCEKRFRHESTRNTHHRTHTGEKPYVCTQCGKCFIQHSNLNTHMRTHTGERPYQCDICDRRFAAGSSMKTHRRTHTGEKPIVCRICNKRFSRVNMRAHLRAHTDERSHACGSCGKRFASAASLRDHLRLHTGETPFECTLCDKKFSTKSHLVKHTKIHDKKALVREKKHVGEKFYKCTSCNEKFTTKSLLVKHTVSHKKKPVVSKKKTDLIEKIEREQSEEQAELIIQEMPVEFEQLVLQDGGDLKTNVLVMDNVDNSDICQNDICLASDGVNVINNDMTVGEEVSLVTVNEGEVSISASRILEGTTMKLYQLDQSLVQIHSAGGQVTISKITSKMTANF